MLLSPARTPLPQRPYGFVSGREELEFNQTATESLGLLPSSDYFPLTGSVDNSNDIRTKIQNLLENEKFQEAVALAVDSNDKNIYQHTACACKKIELAEWTRCRSIAHSLVLPSIESLVKAAQEGDDVLCARILQQVFQEDVEIDYRVRDFVLEKTCEHWMYQTASSLSFLGLLDGIELNQYEGLLVYGYKPLMTHLAKKMSLRIAMESRKTKRRLQNKYKHCCLRFYIRQSKHLEEMLILLKTDYTKFFLDSEFIALCRYQGIVPHMSDQDIIERCQTYRNGGELDPEKSFMVLQEFAEHEYSENLSENIDQAIATRIGRSLESCRLHTCLLFPAADISLKAA